MSSILVRVVCGLLFAAMALGALVHPPANLNQGLAMLLPGVMLLNYAIKGPRRSTIPKRPAPAPAPVPGNSGPTQS
ncbi:hypothetical protein ATI61_113128 [Archangium gephyra]|uniref:Uncharacterized protein n=1 Tax=Archangium gephyra TaxID=48 RepID=A0AAC8TEH5_9BACT|nr:hypothetical protein [Archangium gephyra]AKJ02938.1 Hypothetical protein AA314_04564 [Archangium gephyra]REG25064.1 hypothetical protein ATI61_113128 [Archangium gephyra]